MLRNKQPNKQPNKFSGMSYTEEQLFAKTLEWRKANKDWKKQIHTNWINYHKEGWKDENEELKKRVDLIKSNLYKLNSITKGNEDIELITLQVKIMTYRKKYYSRMMKFNIYCCNDDWENVKLYHIKIQEVMGDLLEYYAENYNEGDLLSASENLKKSYNNIKEVVGQFKEFYEKH